MVISAAPGATAGSSFLLTVKAEDPFNNIATSYAGSVSFSSSDANVLAKLPGISTLSSGLGTFNATLVTAGNQTLTATDSTLAIPSAKTSVIVVSSAAATHFVVTGPSAATAGTGFVFTVLAEDQFNNTATGYTGTVFFNSTDPNAGFGSPNLPTSATLFGGLGRFSATLVTVGNQTLTAADTVNATLTGTLGPIAVSPAAASHFVLAAPTSAMAGTGFKFTVLAEDKFNNTATTYGGTVSFSSTDHGTSTLLSAPGTLVAGLGTFSATLTTAGSQTVLAADTVTPSVTGASNAISVSALAATHFAVVAPSNASPGFGFKFTVAAEDLYNNIAPSYTGTASFSTTDFGAGVSVSNPSTLAAGLGTFSATLQTQGNQTIIATDEATPTISGVSNTINVGAAAASHFVVTAPGSATAGFVFSFTVAAESPANNVTTSYSGTVNFTTSDANGSFVSNSVTLNNGVGTFSATLRTAGNQFITATDASAPTLTGVSNTINVSAAATNHFVVTSFCALLPASLTSSW